MTNDIAEQLALKAHFPKRHVLNAATVGKTENDSWHEKAAYVAKMIQANSLVVLIGTRGGGKTQLATSVTLDAMPRLFAAEKYKPACYFTAQDIFRDIRSSYRNSGRNESSIVDELTTCALLIIDEIHERGQTAFEDRLLVEIIDKRYGAMLPTLIIGNLKPEEFAKQLGPSIADRCREGGGIVVLDGPSHRAQSTTLEKTQ